MGYKWSEDDLNLLKAEYEKSTNEHLRELFPQRTDLAIYKMARKLGLYKTESIKFQNKSNAQRGDRAANWKGGVKKLKTGYVQLYMPSHTRADVSGYVMQHIVVFENATGVSVPLHCVIHHINGNKGDNRIENLCMMTKGAHSTLHDTGRKLSQETRAKISAAAFARLSDKRNHPCYKDVDVDAIISLMNSGVKVKDIAKQFGINRSTVWKKVKEAQNAQ